MGLAPWAIKAADAPFGRVPGNIGTGTMEFLRAEGLVELAPVRTDADRATGRGFDWTLTPLAFDIIGRTPVADPGRYSLADALAAAYGDDADGECELCGEELDGESAEFREDDTTVLAHAQCGADAGLTLA